MYFNNLNSSSFRRQLPRAISTNYIDEISEKDERLVESFSNIFLKLHAILRHTWKPLLLETNIMTRNK